MIHVGLLLDESGSMQPLRDDVIGGVNEYIRRLKEENASDPTTLSVYKFDRSGTDPILRDVFVRVPIEDVTRFEDYEPRGATPLNDAVIESMSSMSRFVTPEDKVIFAIYTDGLENASSEATAAAVQQAVTGREKTGWTFIYLGANQDAWQVGYQYGFNKRGQTYTTKASPHGMMASMSTLGKVTNTMRRAGGQAVSSLQAMPTEIDEEELDVPNIHEVPDDAA